MPFVILILIVASILWFCSREILNEYFMKIANKENAWVAYKKK